MTFILSDFHTRAADAARVDPFDLRSVDEFCDWYERTVNGYDLWVAGKAELDGAVAELAAVKAAYRLSRRAGVGRRRGFGRHDYWKLFIRPELSRGGDLRVLLAAVGDVVNWDELMRQMFPGSGLSALFTDRPVLLFELQDWLRAHDGAVMVNDLRVWFRDVAGVDWALNTVGLKGIIEKFGCRWQIDQSKAFNRWGKK